MGREGSQRGGNSSLPAHRPGSRMRAGLAGVGREGEEGISCVYPTQDRLIILFQYTNPGDGIPPDRILGIFNLHPVPDQRGSRIQEGLIAAPEY